MQEREFNERLLARLSRDSRFLITTHKNADPDGLGAELGMEHLLRTRGADVLIVNQEPLSEKFDFLDAAGRVRAFDVTPGEKLSGRTVVMVDNSDVQRAGAPGNFVHEDRTNLVIIDHHDGLPSDFESTFLAPDVGSTSEIVYSLCRQAGVALPLEVARALYAGIVVDTGHFRYGKTRAQTHRIAAELLELGVEPAPLAERLLDNQPVERLLLKRTLYNQLRLNESRTLAYIPVRRRYVEELNLSYDDLEGIANELIQPTEVQVGILFTEREREMTRVSVRSRGRVDMLPAVVQFGGGGHRNACGATLAVPIEEAVRMFIPVAEEALNASMAAT